MSHTPMTAPAQTSSYESKKKNPNLQLIPAELHSAIIYGVINVGTQEGEYQNKKTFNNKLKLVFEVPGHRQLYWEDDTVPTPTALIMDFNYSVTKNKKTGKKSKLLELIETLFGPLLETQYLTFDISQLADLKVFINVVHYIKKDGTVGAKIESVSKLNPAFVNPATLVRTNPLLIYSVQMGFENMNFAQLPYFYRNLVKESTEGKEFISKGGRFVKLDENNNLVIDDGANNYASVPTTKLVMTGAFTYEQLKSGGWTDQQMIDNGHARMETIAPTPAALPQVHAIPQVPQAPQVPQMPQAPMSVQPQMPQAHTNPSQPMLTMIDKSATYQQFIGMGWTDELLVQHGKAIMMPAANDVFPPAQPPMPQAPPAGMNYTQQIPQAVPQQSIPAPQPTAAQLFGQSQPNPVMVQGAPSAIPQVPQIPQAPQNIPAAPISNFEQPSIAGMEAPVDDLPF